jgi:hypothetical protein
MAVVGQREAPAGPVDIQEEAFRGADSLARATVASRVVVSQAEGAAVMRVEVEVLAAAVEAAAIIERTGITN